MSKTQSQCRADFEAEVRRSLEVVQKIDDETPWSNSEPEWWLELSDLRMTLQSIKTKMEEGKI